MVYGGSEFVVFTFPTANRTFVLNNSNNTWSEWGAWASSSGAYDRYRIQSYAFCPAWREHVGGSREGPYLERLSGDYSTDNGSVIRVYRLTGHVDYGTSKPKQSNEIRLRVKRGAGRTSTPVLVLRIKKDNLHWSREHYVDLGDIGEYEVVRRVPVRGIYRTRQYEFVCTEPVACVFADAEEDIEVLR
jgi:hypothetical protein